MCILNKLLKPAAVVALLASGISVHAQGFTESFDNSAGRVSNSHVGSGFGYKASGDVPDNNYTVMRPQNVTTSTGDSYWADLATDHSGDATGALMVLNAGTTLDDIYVRDFTMLPGHSYRVTGWRYVVNGANGAGSSESIFWSMQIRDPATDSPIMDPNTSRPLYDSGPLGSGNSRLTWVRSTYEFTVAQNCSSVGSTIPARLAITNQSAIGGGNDFYVDDISVEDTTPAGSAEQACLKAVPATGIGGLGLLSLLGAIAGALALHRRKDGAA